MAINKAITIKRIDGSYFKLQGISFERNGMISISGDLWKDVDDRGLNPSDPLISHYSFFITDEEKKKEIIDKILKLGYSELAEYIPELQGGEEV